MENDAHSLREDLYRVIQHYAELAQLAKKGEVDPLGQIGKILKKTVPYLLLVIRDLLPRLERDEMTYQETLFNIIREAQQFSDQGVLIDSRNEIQKIEGDQKVFLYAVKWLDAPTKLRPSPQEVLAIRRKLNQFNEKYKKRYAPSDEETTALIPWFLVHQEDESQETSLGRVADLVRRAVLELHHLMVEYEPARSFFLFTKNSRKEIEEDLTQLAWFLFRCGYSVNRISSGYYKDLLSEFLNEKLLDLLISTEREVDTLQGVSNHLSSLCLLDFSNFFEMPADYIDFDDPRELARHVRFMKSKNRRGANLLKKMTDLRRLYEGRPHGQLAWNFLLSLYYTAFGDYHGEHRYRDPRGLMAIRLYKPLLDRGAMEKRAEEDLKESGRCFSSKTREEMAGLLKLVMNSLENPDKVKGKQVKVLGDISSGAMGKVSIGIFRNQIVALKKVKAHISPSLGNPVTLLNYEAALHARVQTPEQHPYIVEYHGIVDQNDEKLLINGYHPNDNLTQLVERNWQEKYKPPFATESRLNLATLEIIINQLLECLRVFRTKGVVHRDLKTDNILYMVDENERPNRIKVIDFGVALAVGQGAIDDLFKGKVVGTFAYMAPEQARGKSVFQSDLYSVGAIFTVLLTGKLPMVFPKTSNRQDLIKQILRIEREPRPKLTQLNPLLKKNTTLEHIAATVESMMDLDPFRRPNLEEVQAAFDGVFQHVGEAKHSISIYYHKT
jgi:Protein kinase domain